jgi:hypothetical protein
MNKYLRLAGKATGITFGMLFISLFFTFIILNLILGCETWDESLWTEYNSCIKPLQMLGIN